MTKNTEHTFHIPVMGLGFTIDTPAKVAHFGISSVVSIVEDHLIEQMRLVLCNKYEFNYQAIGIEQLDYRALRITAYLNTLHQIVNLNTENLKTMPFE